jgi:hypothetical protein
MECYDAGASVYYPRHQEYVGPRSELSGRCCRCLEVVDAALAARGAAINAESRRRDEARARWDAGEETADDCRLLNQSRFVPAAQRRRASWSQ